MDGGMSRVQENHLFWEHTCTNKASQAFMLNTRHHLAIPDS